MRKREFMMGIDVLTNIGKSFELDDLKDLYEKNGHLTGKEWLKKCKEKCKKTDWDEVGKSLF